ncbi:MAG: homocysteine S-methyltransferase family protein [Vulcanimicrobiota bacterium]
MKKNILELLKERVVIFDGAMGTQLIAQGLRKGECPERWNMDRPGDLKQIHSAYFNAGADVVTTNTFGGTPAKLSNYKLEEKMELINKRAVELAKSVCPSEGYVAGDMGPTGYFLPPVGKAAKEDFTRNFKAQAGVLAEAGVDFLIIETQYDINEGLAALEAARATGLPVFITFTFEKKKRGFFTIMGNRVSQVMKELEKNGADVVGANCSLESRDYEELVQEIKESTDLPVLVQPNAGQPIMNADKVTYGETPQNFMKHISKLVKMGVNAVGACCGTTPDYTRVLAKELKISASDNGD